MPTDRWILYGPTGVTGRLVLAEALARGLRPILAGRDAGKLAALAQPHGLETRVVDLGDAAGLAALCREGSLILNAAGPFGLTGRPLLDAALAAGVGYLDLNGELGFMADTLARDAEARAAGVAGVVGVGFGVVAGDLAAAAAAAALPDATWLRLSVAPASGFASPAVAASTLAAIALGGRRVDGGRLRACALADRRWRIDGTSFAAAPLAELVTTQCGTGIAAITAGTPMPAAMAVGVRAAAPLLALALRVPALARLAVGASGHSATAPAAAPVSRVWASAGNAAGAQVTFLFETGEAYGFAARVAAAAVTAMLAGQVAPGLWGPARAFGPAFLDRIGGASLRRLPAGGR